MPGCRTGCSCRAASARADRSLNDCEVVDDLPEMLHTFFGDPTRAFFFAARPREFCEQNNGFRTSVQGLAAYTIPKIDVQVSGTLQNLPGAFVESNANYGRHSRRRWSRPVRPVQGVPDRRAG